MIVPFDAKWESFTQKRLRMLDANDAVEEEFNNSNDDILLNARWQKPNRFVEGDAVTVMDLVETQSRIANNAKKAWECWDGWHHHRWYWIRQWCLGIFPKRSPWTEEQRMRLLG